MAEWTFITSPSGIQVPLLPMVPEGKPKAVLLMLPALGIRAGFYRKLATGLTQQGIAVTLLEQRGHGESPYRPGRAHAFSLKDYLYEDIQAATDWCETEFEDVDLYIGGHSLGGHMASIAAGAFPSKYAGVLHLACGFPYYGDYKSPASGFIKLVAALAPPLGLLLGYYPGAWFKFGGREHRGLMMDWRHWALKGKYAVPGIEKADADVAAYRGRAISITFDKDGMASAASVDRSCRALASSDLTSLQLGEAEQGEYLGHVEWGKRPDGVVRALSDWFTAGAR